MASRGSRSRSWGVSPESHIVDDLCLDSFDIVWTVMRLWDEVGINIPDELLATIETLGELHAVPTCGLPGIVTEASMWLPRPLTPPGPRPESPRKARRRTRR